MPNLLTIPNEILDEVASYLNPLATFHLLLSCRSLAFLLTPAMHLHAEAPQGSEPALHWAARKGHLPLLQYLLTRFPVDLQMGDQATPLQSACWSCTNVFVAECLLLHGAAVNHTDSAGLTALYYACLGQRENEDIAEPLARMLIAHGADVHGGSHEPLAVAVGAGFTRVVRLLLAAGASPDVITIHGEPVVITAARQAQTVGILVMLLDHGANIDSVNLYGSNALLTAAKYGPLEKVQMLVDRGANLVCQDNNGNTPLFVAIINGQRLIAEYLVVLDGVDIHRGNIHGDIPWNHAMRMGYEAVMQTLRTRAAVSSSGVMG